jgi:gliding motility-associated-like protein
VRLRLNSNGLKYTWTPPATLDDATVKNPVAIPVDSITMYRVQANIGSCIDFDSIEVRTHPYPQANAGPDQTICFGSSANLQASGGSIYSWSPAIFLNDTQIPNPVSSFPFVDHIDYTVTVRNTSGCLKPASDSMRLNIIRIIADAGPRDTAVVLGQPLQLAATGSDSYVWTSTTVPVSPPNWLNNPNIYNPVALAQDDIEYVVTVSNSLGCFDTDTILVKLYKLAADIYVPTAFSPNGDGTNDILKPLALGLLSIDAFRIYNRWGQLLFTTSQIGEGWDGIFKGSPQSSGTYVWYAEGRNFKNQRFQKKGYVVLIR